jgi:hypothetical protein
MRVCVPCTYMCTYTYMSIQPPLCSRQNTLYCWCVSTMSILDTDRVNTKSVRTESCNRCRNLSTYAFTEYARPRSHWHRNIDLAGANMGWEILVNMFNVHQLLTVDHYPEANRNFDQAIKISIRFINITYCDCSGYCLFCRVARTITTHVCMGLVLELFYCSNIISHGVQLCYWSENQTLAIPLRNIYFYCSKISFTSVKHKYDTHIMIHFYWGRFLSPVNICLTV